MVELFFHRRKYLEFFLKEIAMKGKFVVAALVLLCVCIVCQDVMAQPPQGRRSGQRGGGGGQERGPGQRGGGMMGGGGGGMFANVDLTEEQQAKMAKIREEVGEKMRNASPEERREIFGEMREKMMAVLTEEQRAKAGSMFGGRGGPGAQEGRGGPDAQGGRAGQGARQGQRPRTMGPLDLFDMMSARLNLSKEQEGKIARLRAAAMKKLMNDIKAVMTPEQQKRYAQAEERFKNARRNRSTQGRGPRPEGAPGRGGERGERPDGERRERPERQGGERGERRQRGGDRTE